MKILFLCRGNTGRSTFAEGLYKKLSGNTDVMSAGTKLSGPPETLEERLPKTQHVIDVMAEERIDVSHYLRKSVTPQMVNDADLVINMAEPETVPEFVRNHPDLVTWTIKDPKGTSLEEHREIKDEIKNKVISLIKEGQDNLH